jgi:hypothetical protein
VAPPPSNPWQQLPPVQAEKNGDVRLLDEDNQFLHTSEIILSDIQTSRQVGVVTRYQYHTRGVIKFTIVALHNDGELVSIYNTIPGSVNSWLCYLQYSRRQNMSSTACHFKLRVLYRTIRELPTSKGKPSAQPPVTLSPSTSYSPIATTRSAGVLSCCRRSSGRRRC